MFVLVQFGACLDGFVFRVLQDEMLCKQVHNWLDFSVSIDDLGKLGAK